jgi:hypothetical protein
MEAEDNPEAPEGWGVERRVHPRFDVDEDASLLLVGHDSWHPCRVVDLSLEGCRVLTGDLFRAGTQKHVEVSFRINGIAFRLSGTTQWTDGQCAVGIRFFYPTPRRREEFAEVLGEVEAANAVRALREAQEAPTEREAAAESCAVENPEPTAESAPDRVPVEGRAVFAPGSNAQPLQSASAAIRLRGAERRAHVRHEVDTSVQIFLVHLGCAVEGRVLNLSAGGCGIRTREPFLPGIYTRVETEFRLQGMPFRLSGVVQSVYERKLLGIRFLDLSDRKREQLELLMAEVEKQYTNRVAADTMAQAMKA